MPTEPDWLDRASYAVWTDERTRYADTDRQGHVNNAKFATFFESGRVAFLLDRERPLAPAGHGFVVARLAIDFRREMRWGVRVDIGSIVASLGRTSFRVRQALFQDGECASTGESVIVLMADANRRPAELPRATRVQLEAIMAVSNSP